MYVSTIAEAGKGNMTHCVFWALPGINTSLLTFLL